MATDRRKLILLGAVVVVLAVVLYEMWPGTSSGAAPSSNRQAQTRTAPNEPPAASTPEVHLDELQAGRARPGPGERNLFAYKTKAPPPLPPAPPRPVVTAPVVNTAPAVPSGPPPPPPITLKFIGLVEATEHAQKIAILSDGRNVPYYGREGDIIEGRYRILKIGVESIDIAYVDGRGRQTIRLTGG
jgi:hypothetical protein